MKHLSGRFGIRTVVRVSDPVPSSTGAPAGGAIVHRPVTGVRAAARGADMTAG